MIGYLVKFKPYTWEEDSEGKFYHNHFNTITEFYEDECEFNARITELSNGYFEDLDSSISNIYDGVDIDEMYECACKRIK